MILSGKPVVDAMYTILAEEKDITTQQLCLRMNEQYNTAISLPQLYKIIEKMITHQVIVKHDGLLRMNMNRIKKLSLYTKQLEQTYMQQEEDIFSMKEGEKKEYRAASLIDLDPIRNHLLASFASQIKNYDFYSYKDHPYHTLGLPETEIPFKKHMQEESGDTLFVLGNDTFLDTHGCGVIGKYAKHVCTHHTPLFSYTGHCIDIVGNYVIEVVFPENVSSYFEMFFQHITEIKDFKQELFSQIFHMHAPCVLKLTHSVTYATMIKEKMRNII